MVFTWRIIPSCVYHELNQVNCNSKNVLSCIYCCCGFTASVSHILPWCVYYELQKFSCNSKKPCWIFCFVEEIRTCWIFCAVCLLQLEVAVSKSRCSKCVAKILCCVQTTLPRGEKYTANSRFWRTEINRHRLSAPILLYLYVCVCMM